MRNLTPVSPILINQIREKNPVVLTIANMVTPAKVADALSAIGVSPIMSVAPEEAAEMVALADAVTINLGTLSQPQASEIRAVLKANQDKPIVLDPVAVSASKFRQEFTKEILHSYHFTVIRGNAGEIASLANVDWQSRGIDSGSGSADIHKIARDVANQYQCLVVLTGQNDIVTDGQQEFTNSFSSKYFVSNVGSGDMLSSVLAAFLAVSDDPFVAASTAVKFFAKSGVMAANNVSGLGHWQANFMDVLSNSGADLFNDLKEIDKNDK